MDSLHGGSIPAACQYFQTAIRPVLAQQPGFMEAQFFSDPARSQCLVVSQWANQGCCRRAESSHPCQAVFQRMEVYFADQPTVGYFEIVEPIA